jgi:hypothetical protein
LRLSQTTASPLPFDPPSDVAYLGPGVGVQPFDPETAFLKLKESDQLKVLGPARFQLYKDRKIAAEELKAAR